jgi:cyclopropane-fatty-acyl-phospholipid synthase
MTTLENGSSECTIFDRWALSRVQESPACAGLRLVLWNGFEHSSGVQRKPISTIRIKNRRALVGLLCGADLHFGEAYMFNAIEVDGDLLATLEEMYRGFPTMWKPRRWWPRLESNERAAAEDNVHRHYDLGNEFYRLWLDRQMLYTCAYFPRPGCTLEDAQVAKMDLVCRKLRLQRGERVVEAGCGWGALALFMARRYGVHVRAFNLSSEQIAYARDCAKQEHLTHRVEFIEDDYRNVSGSYDVFVSIGMLEHVGLRHYPDFGRIIARSLTPEGRGLLHFIGRNHALPLHRWIRKRIFPGAYPPSLSEVFGRILDPQDLSVLDVENLRLHYAETLEHWRQRFAASTKQIADMFDDSFVRAWQLYLAGSQAAFTTGWMQLFQVVFSRTANNTIPRTRAGD